MFSLRNKEKIFLNYPCYPFLSGDSTINLPYFVLKILTGHVISLYVLSMLHREHICQNCSQCRQTASRSTLFCSGADVQIIEVLKK